jgi:sialic acid synthase SpsE
MGRTLVIAECGSSWDGDLQKAVRLIKAAKECDADVAKFQWTSNAGAMAKRRDLGADAANMYSKYLQYPPDYLTYLKGECDAAGIEFMCTVYLIEDIPVIAPLVKRFKVSAFEATWGEFLEAHGKAPIIISLNPGKSIGRTMYHADMLYCVSEYPTPLDHLHFERQNWKELGGGLSDHTTSTLTGAVAVGAGATIIEKHIKLSDTDKSNPDYGHSLEANWVGDMNDFHYYVANIREAERML